MISILVRLTELFIPNSEDFEWSKSKTNKNIVTKNVGIHQQNSKASMADFSGSLRIPTPLLCCYPVLMAFVSCPEGVWRAWSHEALLSRECLCSTRTGWKLERICSHQMRNNLIIHSPYQRTRSDHRGWGSPGKARLTPTATSTLSVLY